MIFFKFFIFRKNQKPFYTVLVLRYSMKACSVRDFFFFTRLGNFTDTQSEEITAFFFFFNCSRTSV